MDETMEVDDGHRGIVNITMPQPQHYSQELVGSGSVNIVNVQSSVPPVRDSFRDIQVKVHIRRPERDAWVYLGKGLVTQEITGHQSRVVVRAMSNGKTLAVFSEGTDLQAEKRGNFVVIGCVEGSRVVSWSLNATNNNETLRLLASIELACYKSKIDPRLHSKTRRRIERVIRDDRRRRHRRRREQDAMIDAFAKQSLGSESLATETKSNPLPCS